MIRKPAVAGAFYPAAPKELSAMIEGFLDMAKSPATKGRLRALIVPHAGYIYSGPIAAFGYKLLTNCHPELVSGSDRSRNKFGMTCSLPEKIILLGPAHTVGFSGAALSSAEEWETPLGRAPLWRPKLAPPFFEFDLAHQQEHCLEVQLPFLQQVLGFPPARGGIKGGGSFKILPIVIGEAAPEEAAAGLDKLVDEETLIIVSSDLSHYHPYRRAKDLDATTIDAILKGQITVLETQGEACGLLPILIMLHLAKKRNWRGQLLDYRNSGDTFGDKSRVVGYSAIAFVDAS